MSGAAAQPLEGPARRRILDTALELIARYGYNGMSLQLLADQVGLHKSTLFHHFSSKDELVQEAVQRVMGWVLERMEPLAAADPPELEHFVAFAQDFDDFLAERPYTGLFVMRCILGPGDEFYRLDFENTQDPTVRLFLTLGQWLARARRAGVIRPVSVRQAIVDLMGLALFYPALIDLHGGDLPFGDPRSRDARLRRKRELAETVRRALRP